MLKFTAQLSQEFRRASSLSSLKAYQISRQAGKETTAYPQYQHDERAHSRIRSGQHNHHQYDHQYNNHGSRNYHSHNYHSTVPHHFHAPVSHSLPHHCRNSQQKPSINHHYATCMTPKRVRNDIHQLKCHHGHTKSTNIGKFDTEAKPALHSASTKPNNVLIQTNYIKQERSKQIQKKSIYNYSTTNLEQETARRTTNTGLERNSHGAKLRMSSINNLENIQRRIQATLGQQNALRI